MLCSLYFLDTQWHIINSWVHCLPGMVWLSYDSWETTSRLNRCVLNICLTALWLGCGQSSTVCQTRSHGKSCLSVPTRNRAIDNVQGQNIVPSIFSCQMEAIVFIILEIFLVLKTEEYHSDIPQIQLGNIVRWQVSTGQVRGKNIWSQMDYKYVYPCNIMTHDNIVSFSHLLFP